MAVDCPSFLVSGLREPNSQQVPNASVLKLQELYRQNSGYGSSAPLPFKNTTPQASFLSALIPSPLLLLSLPFSFLFFHSPLQILLLLIPLHSN